ncbi:Na/Pi symporter [Bacillus seohaeanensis]|jgi:phosphate:Na+ symporter|uniref:Na/Pi symporter n=1 Tax=Bacillus seohaeanensis TaxID=284580 RepID=A0ABW5RN42_9BACI
MLIHFFGFLFFLGCFLLGMFWLRTGLFNIANEKMKNLLYLVTNHPFKGFLIGMIITAFLHSSSAVMVLTVGLVSTRLITFKQTIGIMLGSNIGTTFTLEMFTLNLNYFSIPALIIGALFILLKNSSLKSIGYIFIGFGLIFISIDRIQSLAAPLTESTYFQEVLLNVNEHIVLALLIGIVSTAIIQSSTVVTGVAMGFLAVHAISLEAGIAIMLGANIGTCITAYLASVGGGKEAKLTAYAHIWLNLIGVAAFIPFISKLGMIVSKLATSPDLQLAHASVIFNLICSLAALPFAEPFSKFIEHFHKKSGSGLFSSRRK